MGSTQDIKRDVFIMFKGSVHAVVDFQHVNPGKGSAFVRTKLKDVQTGKTVENTFKVVETVDIVDMDRATMQYLYKDANSCNFMDNATYEQTAISTDLIGDKGGFLKEGTEVLVLSYQGNPLTVQLPKKMTLKVIESAPAVKGDTASGNVRKEAKLETGVTVQVPIFVKEGDSIIVNTETGEYVERA